MCDKYKNNRIVKHLLETHLGNDRKALAKLVGKSESTVEYWFRTQPKVVTDETLELLRYKLNPKNQMIKVPDDL